LLVPTWAQGPRGNTVMGHTHTRVDRLLIRPTRGDQVGTGSSKETDPKKETLDNEGSECNTGHLHHRRRRHWLPPRTDRPRVSQSA